MVTHDSPTHFSWGLVLLASLYRYLHEYVCMNARALRAGVMLLHVWVWEHIVILRLRVVSIPMLLDDPLMWSYKGHVSFTHTGEHEIPYWRRVLDKMQVFMWHPYLGRPRWGDDID